MKTKGKFRPQTNFLYFVKSDFEHKSLDPASGLNSSRLGPMRTIHVGTQQLIHSG